MIRCLIVDDEEPARELIKLHLSMLDGFEVAASLDNALEAYSYLQNHTVDLVFLDIMLPKLSGLDLLRTLKVVPKVILTTAYREYAADAFDLDVFDYIVKPVTQERFMKAIGKYNSDSAFLFFKVGREQVKIFLNEIIFIEGLADYIKVHTKAQSYIVSEKLGYMEEKLAANSFLRIHKSYIVSLAKITRYNTEQVTLDKIVLPLGRLFKAGFLKAVQSRGG